MEDKKIEEHPEKEKLMHSMHPKRKKAVFTPVFFMFISAAIILGIGSGFLFSKKSVSTVVTVTNSSDVKKGSVVGSTDNKTYKDLAEGVMKKGGVEGEGQYHLVRPGGDSQNVYLTSSTVDLSLFLDKKVKVFGETQKAQTAGWLMDVGRVEVLQ